MEDGTIYLFKTEHDFLFIILEHILKNHLLLKIDILFSLASYFVMKYLETFSDEELPKIFWFLNF